jgi:hypothetical protein
LHLIGGGNGDFEGDHLRKASEEVLLEGLRAHFPENLAFESRDELVDRYSSPT